MALAVIYIYTTIDIQYIYATHAHWYGYIGPVPIIPRAWNFVAFTYDSTENIGTFHINESFGYSNVTGGKDVMVSVWGGNVIVAVYMENYVLIRIPYCVLFHFP